MCVFMLLFAALCQHNLIEATSGSKASQAAALTEMNEIGDIESEDVTESTIEKGDVEAPAKGGDSDGKVEADSKGD